MRLRSHEVEVTTGGQIQQSTEMSVASSEKIFEIFTSSVYTYKIRAFVRELMTNALDAHIEAGHPEKPFLVTLPDMLESVFRVRDYGMGLTPERMQDIYPVLFKSTKDNDNLAVGGFGIGSKSPLSYVDSFTVKSFVDGTLYIYTVYKSGSKIKLDLLSTMKTTEENGVEVSVPVRRADINQTEEEVVYSLIPFDVKPKVIGNHFDRIIQDLDFENDYALLKKIYIRGDKSNQLFARVGCVLYPINEQTYGDFPDSLFEESLGEDNVAIIDIPVGEVDIQPSREELDYTDHTKEVVIEHVNRVVAAFDKDFQEIVSAAKYNDINVPFIERYIDVQDSVQTRFGSLRKVFLHDKIKLDAEVQEVENLVEVKDAVTGVKTMAAKHRTVTKKLKLYTFISNFLDDNKKYLSLSCINSDGDPQNVGAPSHYKHAIENPFRSPNSFLSTRGIAIHKMVKPMRILAEQHEETMRDAPTDMFLYREDETLALLKSLYGKYVHVYDLPIEKSRAKTQRQAGVYKVYGVNWLLQIRTLTNDVRRMSKEDVLTSEKETYYLTHKYAAAETDLIFTEVSDWGKRSLMHKIVGQAHNNIVAIPHLLLNEAQQNPKWKPVQELFDPTMNKFISVLENADPNGAINQVSSYAISDMIMNIKGNKKTPNLEEILFKDVPDYVLLDKDTRDYIDSRMNSECRAWIRKGYAGIKLKKKLENMYNRIKLFEDAIRKNHENFLKHYDLIRSQIRFSNKSDCVRLELLVDMIRSYNGGKK